MAPRISKPQVQGPATIRRSQSPAPTNVRSHKTLETVKLQRTLGNQTLQRFLHAGLIQAKLRISQPSDPYEQEADRVADQVMRMPEPGVGGGTISSRPASIQRVCAACEEELQREVMEEQEELVPVRAKRESAPPSPEPSHTESFVTSLPGRGEPLPESVRGFMEPRFGVDFSAVRVHADAAASHSAEDVQALAYTAGPHIVFRAGRYDPRSPGGQRLLAHELTHVVQQEGSAPAGGALPMAPPSTAAEQEAERAADVTARHSPSVSRHDPGLQRQPAPAANDCKGWETDRDSLVTAVARHYAQAALDPPVTDLIREVKFSRDKLIATAHFEKGLELFVSLYHLPDSIHVTTHGYSNVKGPRCSFGYSCPPDGTIVFTTKSCE